MRSLHQFVLAFALYLALILNAGLSLFLHHFLAATSGANLLLPISMMLISLFDDTNPKELWLALGTGMVSDLYFWGILGINTVILPLICWLLQKAARFLPEVFWSRMLIVLVAVIGLTAYSWLILNLTGLSSIPLMALLKSLLPTLGWSLVLLIIVYPIWARLAIKYPFMVNLANYR